MPAALLKQCSYKGGCGELVEHGLCPRHARQHEQARGTRTERGYGAAWERFRRFFINLLIQAGVTPVCGARLVGPSSPHSRCGAEGRLVDRSADGSDLHFDHDPPLSEAERLDDSAVCDKHRITLLCRECHSAKTAREQRGDARPRDARQPAVVTVASVHHTKPGDTQNRKTA